MESRLIREMAEHQHGHWWFQGRRAVVRAVLRRALGARSSARILDVGCGPGGMLDLLTEFGEVEGLESSPECLELARERFGDRVVLHQGALPGGMPPGERYDLITALDVIEHLDDPVGALVEMRDALRPGGVIACTVPAFELLWSEHDDINHHKRRYTRSLLLRQLRAAELEPAYSSYFNTALFPPIAAVRLAQRVLPARRSGEVQETDAQPPPPAVNWLLARLFAAESLVVPRVPMPFGVSLIAVTKPR